MKLDDATRYQLLKPPGYAQRELAATMGVSVGKANFASRLSSARAWSRLRTSGAIMTQGAYAYLLTPMVLKTRPSLPSDSSGARWLSMKFSGWEIAGLTNGDGNP